MQNDAATADGDPATSDALFVVQTAPTVAVGDRVRISGAVQELASSPSYNQAVMTTPAITVLASGTALPAFTTLDNATFSGATAELFEGMLVQFLAPVTVADVAALKSRGELTISIQGLVYQPTQFVDPNDSPATGTSSAGSSNLAAVTAYQAANMRKSLVLDDGRSTTNPSPIPYLDAITHTVRVGSPAASASYVYNGLSGSLDHAVLTPNLVNHTAVEKWHINASESEFLEYDVAGAATDITSPCRSSDHDPILIGLNFSSVVTAAAQPQTDP